MSFSQKRVNVAGVSRPVEPTSVPLNTSSKSTFGKVARQKGTASRKLIVPAPLVSSRETARRRVASCQDAAAALHAGPGTPPAQITGSELPAAAQPMPQVSSTAQSRWC
eukprot:CAMPEP_0195055072 /NCGR_PEP_ID=MMETSP0448-20130528/3804_1 /TAXON_ID=66468 /ORGANISM="Heterocapsa triquestra, Strain CCMP 448" /LENGTH=108 /DNA_ID=CAMNT_0040084667 /DNA_START=361 /DNA_END=688 /DNA_ORIENTATION=+